MTDDDWESGFAKSVAVYLNGQGIPDLDVRGQRVTDDSFVLCFNAHYEPIEFTLAAKEFGAAWVPVIYTADTAMAEEAKPVTAGAKVAVDARAVMVLQAAESPASRRSLDDVEDRVAVLRRAADLAGFAPVLLGIQIGQCPRRTSIRRPVNRRRRRQDQWSSRDTSGDLFRNRSSSDSSSLASIHSRAGRQLRRRRRCGPRRSRGAPRASAKIVGTSCRTRQCNTLHRVAAERC